jgi:hypothetical protein
LFLIAAVAVTAQQPTASPSAAAPPGRPAVAPAATPVQKPAALPAAAPAQQPVASPVATPAPAAAPAGDAASRWQAAADAYQARDFATAEKAYESLLRDVPLGDRVAPDLSYNLGNVYFREGHKGLAAWMYEKTLAVTPRHHDARANLGLTRTNSAGGAAAPGDAASGFILLRPVTWLWERLTAGEWCGLFLAAWWAAAATLVAWVLAGRGSRRRRRRLAGRLAVAAGALALATGLFFVTRWTRAEYYRYGIVVAAGAIVRAAPGPDEEKYFEAREAEKLEVSDASVRGWLRVKRPSDGRVGFLPAEAVREI